MQTYDEIVETAAKAIAFYHLRNYGRVNRWPSGPLDHFPDADGVAPIAWHFAEECRAEARVVLEAIGITPE